MKQLTDSERLAIAIPLLDAAGLFGEYEARCDETEHDCERNGFHNTPAECEGDDCAECQCDDVTMRELDCPYVD